MRFWANGADGWYDELCARMNFSPDGRIQPDIGINNEDLIKKSTGGRATELAALSAQSRLRYAPP